MSEDPEETGDINDILREIGVPGRYQLLGFFWTFLLGVVASFQTVVVPFTQGDMNYRCVDGYNKTQIDALENKGSEFFNNTCTASDYLNTTDVSCAEFAYDQSIFHSSIISEFDLVCSGAFYVTLSNIIYSAVAIPSGIFTGWLSDRIGRRAATVLHAFIVGVVGITTAFSVNIEMYILLRCLMSISTTGLYDSTNTHLSEITSPSKRPHVLIGSVMSWGVGIIIITGLAYLITDWMYLQLAISVPSVVCAVLAIWAYDESPHWLYSKERYADAQKVLDKMARWNKCTDKNFKIDLKLLSRAIGEDKKEEDNERSEGSKLTLEENSLEKEPNACLSILRSPRFVAVFLICSFGWFSCNLGYYGLLVGISDLVGDLYVNNSLGGLVELVAYSLCFLILKGGRKKIYFGLLIIGGAGLLSSGILSAFFPDVVWAIVSTTMLGRLCISAGWQVLYVWCVELFPTSVRVTMLQASLTSGHIGSTVGFFMADLNKVITDPNVRTEMIAPLTYGSLLIISALTSLYLPETNNRPLPVTIADAITANSGKKQSVSKPPVVVEDEDLQTKL